MVKLAYQHPNLPFRNMKILKDRFYYETGIAENLAEPTTVDDISITVPNGALYIAGETICIHETGIPSSKCIIIKSVDGNILYLTEPVDRAYTVAAIARKVITNMATAGLTTSASVENPIIFELRPPEEEIWHVYQLLICGINTTVMDDANFIGIAALPNGCVLREYLKERESFGGVSNLANWKANGDMLNVQYSLRSPAGVYGLKSRFEFIKDLGYYIELNGKHGDYLQLRIQDPLTGIDGMEIRALGHEH